MGNVIDVGIGEVKIARAPAHLRTSLGSCVGVALYDPTRKWGGIAHVVSPKSDEQSGKVTTYYADVAVATLLDLLYERGCRKENFVCFIGGGGCMFGGVSDVMDVGKKNIEAVRRLVLAEDLKVSQEIVGGNYVTVMLLDANDGTVRFERKESTLKIVMQKERNHRQEWVDQNEEDVARVEEFLKGKRNEFMDSSQKVNSQDLLNVIRSFCAGNKISRLVGFVVYSKMSGEFRRHG